MNDRESVRRSLARYYELPRNEVMRLEREQKIAWVLADLHVDPGSRLLVESVMVEEAALHTPLKLSGPQAAQPPANPLTAWLNAESVRSYSGSSELVGPGGKRAADYWTVRLLERGATVSIGHGPDRGSAVRNALAMLPREKSR